MRENDKAFIFSTWLRGVYYGETVFKHMNKDRFMESYHNLIEMTIAAPNTLILIACLKEDEDVILGYAALNKNKKVVYWAYVKSAWRNIGLSKMLLGSDIHVATTLTVLGLNIMKRKNIEFNPFTI